MRAVRAKAYGQFGDWFITSLKLTQSAFETEPVKAFLAVGLIFAALVILFACLLRWTDEKFNRSYWTAIMIFTALFGTVFAGWLTKILFGADL